MKEFKIKFKGTVFGEGYIKAENQTDAYRKASNGKHVDIKETNQSSIDWEVIEVKERSDGFGRVLIKHRKELDLTQEKFGELINMHSAHISQLETGIISPSFFTIEKICRRLDMTTSEFFS